jgi:hypothetical protein
LPQDRNVDSVERLHETVKSLNRNQLVRAVRFRGDGTGRGVSWGRVQSPPNLIRISPLCTTIHAYD